MLKRNLTVKDKALVAALAILLVAAVYFLVVDIPVRNGIASAQSQMEDTQMNIDLLNAKAIKLKSMRDELEVLKADGDAREIPTYDNLSGVIKFLNSVLGSATDYQVTMNTSMPGDGAEKVVRRTAQVSFECDNYADAKASILKLENSDNLDRVSNLVITPLENGEDIMDSPVKVSVSITFFERIPS